MLSGINVSGPSRLVAIPIGIGKESKFIFGFEYTSASLVDIGHCNLAFFK